MKALTRDAMKKLERIGANLNRITVKVGAYHSMD